MKNCSALDVLEHMEKHGIFSPTDIQSLAGLLELIDRYDLVKHAEDYQQKYGKEVASTFTSVAKPLPLSFVEEVAACIFNPELYLGQAKQVIT